MKPLLPGLLFAALLAGCATSSDPLPGVSHGRLVLREALAIPPDAATVRLQYGRVVASNSVQEHDPFCVFELNTVAPAEQTVRPGAFAITRVVRSVETFAGMPVFRPMRVGLGDDGGGPTHIYYKTIFHLKDDAQPVRALTCMSNQNAPGIFPFMRHLTGAEIRQALGTLFVLEFPFSRP
jgi:hypothetical protein